MKKLQTLAEKYALLDQQEKNAKKLKTPLNKEIKELMVKGDLSTFEHGGVTLSYSTQNRNDMNEDALVEKLKSLGLTEAIQIVEKPNEEMITQLIYEGKLSASDLESCVTTKVIEVLKVSVKKK